MKQSKLQAILVFILAIFCINLAISALNTQTAFAYNATTDGNQKTARLKEWYSPFKSCLDTYGIYSDSTNTEMDLSDKVKPESIRSGNWWVGGGILTIGKALSVNPYIERAVASSGNYGDGKIICGENNNTLLSSMMSQLNGFKDSVKVDKEDIVCDYKDHTADGSLSVPTQINDCDVVYKGSFDFANNVYFVNDKGAGASYNVGELIKDKLFDGEIPATYMTSLSDLEKYYVIHDAFTNACTQHTTADEKGGDLATFKQDGNYIIQEYDSSSKGMIDVGYYGNNNVGANSNIAFLGEDTRTCQEMASFLSGEKIDDYLDGEKSTDAVEDYMNYLDENDENPPDLDTGNDKTKVDCLSSGAAENLGWIICPILSFASDQAQNLYNELIEPALQINPELIGGDDSSNNNAYQAWTIFQGFANTLFIIFFLFVIFSQVTGVGIDNYGIKKILPKLIIAAILVNLSYVICQVCVDLSNIVGNGIQTLFNGLPVTIDATIENNGVTRNVGEEIGTTMISAVGIAGAAYLAYVTVALWILPLIVALIGVIISIIFLFILLAGRQAIVVLMVVISPLAFVCYLLPNTKKLFDKYVKIGETMLLLYPICSLLVAGGGYVSKLFLSVLGAKNLNLFEALTAMLISIVPIFFIPKVVKSSFSALGSMGATLSGFGARLSGRAKGAIKGSGAYKAGQERLGEARTRWRAGVGKDGKPVDMTLGQRLARGSFTNRGIARARAQALKDKDARDRAERLSGDIGFEAALIAQEKAAKSDQVNDYMAYINSETNNGEDEDAFNELVKKYTKEGQENEFGALAAARIAGRRKDTADKFLNNHFNNANYSEQLRKSLAKEIATGENSANYRASSPLGFEYASQVNSGNTSAASYSTWKGNQNNIHDALDHHVTNSRELVGMKRSSLEEMYDLAQKGQMQESDIDRISRLARSTINERDKTGVWDSTKETVINQLANLRTVQTQPKQPSIIMGTEGQFQEEMRQRHNNPPKPSGQNNNN